MTQETPGKSHRGKRPFVLYDDAGVCYQPVKNYNRTVETSFYKIKQRGTGNKAVEPIETEDIVDVARAMLVDRLASRVQKTEIPRGPVHWWTYGDELVRYEIDPEIAQEIGVPPQG